MQWLTDKPRENGSSPHFVFTDTVLSEYIEDVVYLDMAADLEISDPAFQRVHQIKSIKPGMPRRS